MQDDMFNIQVTFKQGYKHVFKTLVQKLYIKICEMSIMFANYKM